MYSYFFVQYLFFITFNRIININSKIYVELFIKLTVRFNIQPIKAGGDTALINWTREITRPWLRETGKRAKRAEEQLLWEQCIIVGFRLRLMTLQQISSNHAPCKSPFDQTSPFLLVVAASEWPPAGVGQWLFRETGPLKKGAQICTCNFSTST